jgi:hypothetical protein
LLNDVDAKIVRTRDPASNRASATKWFIAHNGVFRRLAILALASILVGLSEGPSRRTKASTSLSTSRPS